MGERLNHLPCFQPHVDELRKALGGIDPLVFVREADDGWIKAHLDGSPQVSGAWAGEIRADWGTTPCGRRKGGAWRDISSGTTLARITAFRSESSAEPRPDHPCLLWLSNLPQPLPADVEASLKLFAMTVREKEGNCRILVSGPAARAPAALSSVSHDVTLRRPNKDEIKKFVEVIHESSSLKSTDLNDISERLRGLEASMAVAIVRRSLGTGDAAEHVRKLREQLVTASAIEVVQPKPELKDSVGGMWALKRFLEEAKELREALGKAEEDRRKNIEPLVPKGMLLVGLPGCGKSLAAELTAAVFAEPLLQLHAGRMMGQYLGNSEANLQDALECAEAASPCVLWIDELEKAVGGMGGDGDGATGGRLLGTLLSWMQNNRRVFVVATANSIKRVPAELLRRGRFDEHFVVNLPKAAEREQILMKKLANLGCSLAEQATLAGRLAADARTNGFSGADLEAVVAEAGRNAQFRCGFPAPNADDFESLIPVVVKGVDRAKSGVFVPQAHQWKAKFAELEVELKDHNFRDASGLRDQPKRTGKAAAGAALHRRLAALLEDREEVVLRWTWSNESPFTLHFFTSVGTRLARLGRGHVASVPEAAKLADYTASRTISGGRAVLRLSAGVTEGNFPREILVDLDGGHEFLVLKGGNVRPDPARATLEAVRSSEGLPPELWKFLAAEGRLHEFGSSVRLCGEGAGRERRVFAHNVGDEGKSGAKLVEYRVQIAQTEIRLVDPSLVKLTGAWNPDHDVFLGGFRISSNDGGKIKVERDPRVSPTSRPQSTGEMTFHGLFAEGGKWLVACDESKQSLRYHNGRDWFRATRTLDQSRPGSAPFPSRFLIEQWGDGKPAGIDKIPMKFEYNLTNESCRLTMVSGLELDGRRVESNSL